MGAHGIRVGHMATGWGHTASEWGGPATVVHPHLPLPPPSPLFTPVHTKDVVRTPAGQNGARVALYRPGLAAGDEVGGHLMYGEGGTREQVVRKGEAPDRTGEHVHRWWGVRGDTCM